jgi:hypothetical protein
MGKLGKFPLKQMMNEELVFGKKMKILIQITTVEL